MTIDKNFWNIWSSYAIYYFGKVNLGIIMPALLATYPNLNLYSIGLVSSGFFFAYALGQFVHGQVSERFNPYMYIALGMILSGLTNIVLGFSAGFFIILFLGESLNGFFQSMGWSSCVRANALTQEKEKREKSSMLLGTSYQIGNSMAWLVSAFAVGAFGWQAGFFVASAFLIGRGILLWMFRPKINFVKPRALHDQIKCTFINMPIILSGLALCLLNMVRFGVIIWIPTYLFLSENLTIAQMPKVGLTVFLIPLAGVLGTLVFSKLKVKKEISTMVFLILLAVSFVIFPYTSGVVAIAVLLTGGFFLYGPHVFFVTTMPTRYTDQNIVASSTGFIDGMGYIGTVLVGVVVPVLVNLEGWKTVFFFWAGLAIAIVGIMLIIDIYQRKEHLLFNGPNALKKKS